MPFANNDGFVSFLPICIPFIPFSYLTALARTYSMMLKSRAERVHPCLVLDLSGNAFSFSLLSMTLAVHLVIYGFYYVDVGSLYAYFLESFYHKWMLNFINTFSASIKNIIWFLFFNSLMWCITLTYLKILKNP